MDTAEKNWLEDLEAVYETAVGATPDVGDTAIIPNGAGGYVVRPAVQWDVDAPLPELRILKRAPKPKPKPFAIVASATYLGADEREVFVPSETFPGEWESAQRVAVADHLVDPVPLVELPSREELIAALKRGYDAWEADDHALGAANDHRADAVLELLEGRA